MTNNLKAVISPFIIIAINVLVAIIAGEFIGKWAFVPIILIEWMLFIFCIKYFGSKGSLKTWTKPINRKWGWKILAISMGLLTLPLLLMHYDLLVHWQYFLPWLILALVNPFLEEFYWRGLLLDATSGWKPWQGILFSSSLFALNHAVFGINSVVNSGFTTIIVTFVMGIAWSLVYKKTGSLRWTILGHFLVDTFSVSSLAFLDLFQKQSF